MHAYSVNKKDYDMISRVYAVCIVLLFLTGCKSSSPEILAAKDILDPNWKTDTCDVHNEKLIEAVEPLIIGKVSFDGEYYEARAKFPYAMTRMQSDGPEYYWRVRYCLICREGLKAWEAKTWGKKNDQ
jgi:hypothetical protein